MRTVRLAAALVLAASLSGCPKPDSDAGGFDASEDAGSIPDCIQNKDCNDFNPCTDDTCDASGMCVSVIDDANEVVQGGPTDCLREVCQGGMIVVLNDASEVPPPVSPIDCQSEACQDGMAITVNSDVETPFPDEDPCTADLCDNGGAVYTPVADGTGCDSDDDPVTVEICAGGACVPSECGDGAVDASLGEDCDPGAPQAGDGCSNLCTIPPPLSGLFDLDVATPDARVVGPTAGDEVGGHGSVAIGDVDGDSVADLVAGAPGSAEVFVVLGVDAAVGGWPASRDLASTPADVVIDGPVGPDFPSALATGDVSGDGIADIIIGASSADGGSGAASGVVWVIFGRDFAAAGATTAFDLAAGDADLEFTPIAAGDALGAAVGAADVTGDGTPDLMMGAPGSDGAGGLFPDAGEVYVFAGGGFTAGTSTPVLVADLVLSGDTGDALGTSVAAGDVGGSSVADVIAGAPGHDGSTGTLSGAGAVAIVYGTSFSLTLVAFSSADVIVHGGDAGDALGTAVASGDFNGDGDADLFYGAPEGDTFMNAAPNDGDAYTAWGPFLPGEYVATQLVLPEFFGGGAELYGEGEDFGAVIGSGDINDDGYGDLVVTDRRACSVTPCVSEAGETYMVLGRPFTSGPGIGGSTRFQVVLSTFQLTIRGATTMSHLGSSLAVGDLDADGLADLAIGVPGADTAGGTRVDGGEVVIFFGGGNVTPP